MKKILISVVISLCFFNSAISEVVILRCESVSIKEKKDGKLINKPNNWYSIFKVDLKNNYYERDDDGYKNYFINYNDKLLKYSIWNSSSSSLLGTSFPYRISFGHISRVTGEWIYKSMYISNNDYENLKIKIDNKYFSFQKSLISFQIDLWQYTKGLSCLQQQSSKGWKSRSSPLRLVGPY